MAQSAIDLAPQGKILIVEDEPEIRDLVRLYLHNGRFATISAENGGEAIRLLEQEQPDLILLDILLPDTDGLSLCKEIRKRSAVPIIFLTCKRDADDIVNGLDTGGDDYMTKPFDPVVLLARVKAHLRRAGMKEIPKEESIWQDDRLSVNWKNFEVHVANQPVPLFAKERQLLLYLVRHANQVFSVEQLYEHIWGWDRESDERTVMVHISNLRKKIEADPTNPKYIVTVRGFGYKFSTEASS